MMLSANFSLEELTKSQTAERQSIPNNPGADEIYYIRMVAEKILQPVSSGFRSPELCEAIGSNGATSQHTKGQAVDFEVPGISNMDLAYFIKTTLDFDQLILEFYKGGNTGWVHCSVADTPRKDLLTYDKSHGYRKGLIDGS